MKETGEPYVYVIGFNPSSPLCRKQFVGQFSRSEGGGVKPEQSSGIELM